MRKKGEYKSSRKNRWMLILGIVLLLLPFANAAWLNSSYAKKLQINITGGTAVLNNFTVFINVTYNSNMSSDFRDILFTDSSETSSLFYELDTKINLSHAGFWVKIPILNVGVNTIYMYYSNPNATSLSDGINAWDNYYRNVYHLNGNAIDSKGNVNGAINGIIVHNTTNCAFGTCFSFFENDGYIQLDNSFDNFIEFTVEGWGYLLSIDDYRNIMGQSGIANDRSFHLRSNLGTYDEEFGVYKSDATYVYAINSNQVGLNKFQYYAGTSGINLVVYLNQTKTIGGIFADASDISGNPAGIGAIFVATEGIIQEWVGQIDEVRFSTINRDSAWLARNYQNANLSNVVFGTEQSYLTPANASIDDDNDHDGVNDTADICQNTPFGVEVDLQGCSNIQFCALQSACGFGCDSADWKNNEPLSENPRDCMTVVIGREGKLSPACAALEGLVCGSLLP